MWLDELYAIRFLGKGHRMEGLENETHTIAMRPTRWIRISKEVPVMHLFPAHAGAAQSFLMISTFVQTLMAGPMSAILRYFECDEFIESASASAVKDAECTAVIAILHANSSLSCARATLFAAR